MINHKKYSLRLTQSLPFVKHSFFLLFVLLFFHAFCFSQVENRATLSYTFYAPESNEIIATGNQSNVDLAYFLKSKMIAKKILWDNSFGYKTAFFGGETLENFQDVNYITSFVYTKNRKNFIIGNVRLNYRSEIGRDFLIDAIFPTASLGYMRQSQTNKSIRWAAGVNYNNDFGKNVILPFIIFNYETQKIKFNATLPSAILLLIRNNPKIYYGLNATLNSGIFQTEDDNDGKIQILNANMFAFSQIKLKDKLWLEVKPGFTIRRDFNFLQSNFDRIPVVGENRLDPNFVIMTGLLYRMN